MRLTFPKAARRTAEQADYADLGKVEEAMKQKDVAIHVDLGVKGKFSHRVYTCDLSREYIAINADYHT